MFIVTTVSFDLILTNYPLNQRERDRERERFLPSMNLRQNSTVKVQELNISIYYVWTCFVTCNNNDNYKSNQNVVKTTENISNYF